ncbi:MAG: uroporphyrinogen decarboxylase family protein [Dehalococcoidales bacterium]|nr:uroporphyrinogen decarboxylase family protein [Dehalococcoidales bacterium]
MPALPRDRFLEIARFQRPNDLCLMTPVFNDFWAGTLETWVKQGAPEQILNGRFRQEYLQMFHIRSLAEVRTGFYPDSSYAIGGRDVYLNWTTPIVPRYEPKVLSEDERTVTLTNYGGQTARIFKDNPTKMPMFIDYPVKDRATWKEFQKRLDPDAADRFPADWQGYVQRMNSRPEPTMLFTGSFFGFLREWVGVEKLLYMFYDDPALIEEMMEQMCYLETECIKRILPDLRVDFVYFWEDMAFKTGPLISPAMFRKFMLPRYKRVTDLLRSRGVDVIFVDSDGNVESLIPLWIESGVNAIWPLECAAGMDAVAVRKKYGKDLILSGNIDKRALMQGKEAIRTEVMSKLPFLLKDGGYFPSLDHLVPPDVPWENFLCWLDTMREVTGLPKLAR